MAGVGVTAGATVVAIIIALVKWVFTICEQEGIGLDANLDHRIPIKFKSYHEINKEIHS